MNPSQVEKIKSLIAVSSILDSAERQEWLTLLGLMNDKQLLELQKILTSSIPITPVGMPARGVLPEVKQAKPFSPLPVRAEEKSNKTPSLSHIMNLPNVKSSGGYQFKGEGQPLRQVTPSRFPKGSISSLSDASVKKQGFLARIKNVFSEKELPPPPQSATGGLLPESSALAGGKTSATPQPQNIGAGQAGHPTELTGKEKAPNVLTQVKEKIKLPPQVPKPPKVEKPQLQKQQIKTELNEKNPTLITLNKGGNQEKQVAVDNINLHLHKGSSAVIYSGKGAQQLSPTPEDIETMPMPRRVREEVLPGLRMSVNYDTGTTGDGLATESMPQRLKIEDEFIKNKIAAKARQPESKLGINQWPELKDFQKSQTVSGIKAVDIKVQVLDDLVKLKVKDFSSRSALFLLREISGLVKHLGYHQVIFNLEKSPLYQAYLKTGLDILKNNGNFADLKGTGEEFMPKEQFENFTDFLREIRAV